MAGVAMVDVLLGLMVIVWVVVVISGTVVVTVWLKADVARIAAAMTTAAITIANETPVWERID
jgi:hypothetical protein